jgi:predicted RNA-binding protein YlxR (DUF448 family)
MSAAGAITKKKSTRGPRPKHVPQRTCIACRTAAPKRSFVRVVRTPIGEVVVDPTGQKSGRGASICGTRVCWAKALAGSLLDRALRVSVSDEDRTALRAFFMTLPDDDAGGDGPATPASPAGGATTNGR